MNTLFGIPMDTIMRASLTAFVLITLAVAFLAVRQRLLVKLGLRNIPRRRAQTVLIVVGLMLSTVLITSAFATGDTMSASIRGTIVTNLSAIDELVTSSAGAQGGATGYFPAIVADRIRTSLAAGHTADGVTGAIVQAVALQDLTTRQTRATVELLGVPAAYPAAFGPLTARDGAAVTLGQLGAGQVYLNATAQQALSADAGDRLQLFIAGRRVPVVVRAVLRTDNLAAGGLLSAGVTSAPVALLPLGRLQRLAGRPGRVNMVVISNRGDALGGVALTTQVTAALRAPLAIPAGVAAATQLLRTPRGLAALRALQTENSLSASTKTKLRTLQAQLRVRGQSATVKSLLVDPAVIGALKTITQPAIAIPLNTALAGISAYTVQTVKQDGLDQADQAGTEFSSVFLVFGLFSIAAGIMLIFLIFVMLAAERRAEMGMARAVGMKCRHLIAQFVFEGYAYDLGAALVGAALGIGVGLGMVSIIAALVGAAGFTLQPQIAPRSVVVAFCLGALVTFLTVTFSAWRVSHLTIVAAIRDLPEDARLDGSIGTAFGRPWTDLATAGRRLRRGRVLAGLISALAAPWHLLTAFRVFISRGPLLLLAGVPLAMAGLHAKLLLPFSLGVSLLLIGAAMLLRWALGGLHVPDRLRDRIGFSLAGVALVVYWLLPFDAIRSDFKVDASMFFPSGLMLVLGSVWTVMYNSDVLLAALLALFGRVRALAPILTTAVSYPLQYRFRTGLTLAMFSLVIFTLMVMSVLTSSLAGTGLNLNRDIGGYQVYGTASPLTPIRDVAAAVRAAPTLHRRLAAVGSMGAIPVGLRQPGQNDQSWQSDTLNVADTAYLGSTRFTLHARARGYGSDGQVWQALRTHPGDTIVAGGLVPTRAGNASDSGGFQIQGFSYEDTRFTPTRIDLRDTRTGAVIPLTVIGVLDRQAQFAGGLYTSQATLAAAHDAPAVPTTFYFRVAPGQDVHQAARALGSAFLANGLDVQETQVQYDQAQSVGAGLTTLLEGFMALGLVVGIAALGVIATRSVVERRQQIGMLRAIGFQRRMVQASFLFESSFVALTGIALGLGAGLMLARQLIGFFGKTNPGLQLVIPWPQIGGIVALAYVASLLTTYLPARQAARIYPAEALRYE